jgi:hypothetical protein
LWAAKPTKTTSHPAIFLGFSAAESDSRALLLPGKPGIYPNLPTDS